ncbi:TrbI/VirB10 family protein [Rivularia sp. UHCC 0363]|uniref:TrbI/VirB10 family protein n=1 Tax=Rivularia sp. UHCC 0363 TaxID=3110244 RepID=UPI002B1FCE69|nr:TrbI/VirB10 family protein [Rivularia sp. UHCC 0363]MEA5596075.1 TrbI/VirB10 family protein [Rivularia sp. UHCC 0363]
MIKSTSSPNSDGLTEWEMRMAKLVGLDESTPAEIEMEPSTDVIQPDEPTSVTPQPLSANPFAKAGLVGAATLTVVMFAGGFLSKIMSNDNSKPTQNAIVRPTTPQPETKPRQQQLEEQVEGLKTKLALSEQLEAVKTAQQKLRMVKPIPSAPRIAANPTPEIQPQTIPRDASMSMIRRRPQTPAVRIVEVPKIVTVDRIVKVPQISQQPRSPKVFQPVAKRTNPKPLSVLPPAPPALIPTPQPLVEIVPPQPNPLQEWTRLAKLGSYGQVSLNEKQTVSNRTSPQVEVARDVKDKETPTKPIRETRTAITQPVRRNPKTVLVGSSARATLTTAIYGETTKSDRGDSENNNVYVMSLKQPLKAADGTVALPIGSQILTKINSISENGLMQLEIVKIMMRENGQLAQKSVSQNVLMIRGKSGKPLIAKQYSGSNSSMALMDAGLFALGGLGKAAELINRTESEVVTGENGTIAVTNVNRNPDMAAGILEGGMKTVIPQITRRNQRAMSEMSRKTNIWFLPPGKEVEIFVNQETEL